MGIRKIAAGLLAMLILGACGAAPAPSARTSPSPSPAPSPSSPATPSALPAVSPAPSPAPTPPACPVLTGGRAFSGGAARPAIVDVRVGEHGTYERLVVEFAGAGIPSYRLEPNPGGTTFVRDGRGDTIVVLGSYGVLLRLDDLDTFRNAYAHGTDLRPDFSLLKEVRLTGDFEAVVTLAIGLGRPVCPVVTELQSPPRLVLDFPLR